jgi:hypothetical protein
MSETKLSDRGFGLKLKNQIELLHEARVKCFLSKLLMCCISQILLEKAPSVPVNLTQPVTMSAANINEVKKLSINRVFKQVFTGRYSLIN